ncbi:transglycosylase domain-containing protein [Granulicella rosea]|nr:biosynthetic peptidoglycan transglycosylase [Granulicella rosea]
MPTAALTPFFPALTAAEGPAEDETSELLQVFSTSPRRSGHYASSIARGMLCSDHKNLRRNFDEMLLSFAIAASYSKQQRQAIYLNCAYFGDGQVGIAQASHFYFDEPPDELDLPARTLLVGLVQSPNRLSPFRHPDRALARRSVILEKMLAEHSITLEEATEAKAASLPAASQP